MPMSRAWPTTRANSHSSMSPYPPPTSWQPNPMAETSMPVAPSGRSSITDAPSCEPATDREVLDPAVDRRVEPFHRARHLERLEAREEMVEHRGHLHAGQVRAHAEVGAGAECEVGVGIAVDAERERVVEHVVVAVGRREEQR